MLKIEPTERINLITIDLVITPENLKTDTKINIAALSHEDSRKVQFLAQKIIGIYHSAHKQIVADAIDNLFKEAFCE